MLQQLEQCSYTMQAIHMSQKAMSDEDASEGDVLCAPKLLEVILQNCRGRVDECIPLFINLALTRSEVLLICAYSESQTVYLLCYCPRPRERSQGGGTWHIGSHTNN